MKKSLGAALLLAQFWLLPLVPGAALAQTEGAAKALLQQTLKFEQALTGPQSAKAETGLFNLLRAHPDSVLKPYWLHLLARLRTHQDDPRNYLRGQKALSTAYYAWRVMQTPLQFCSRDWEVLARLLPLSPVVPTVSDSTQLQKRSEALTKGRKSNNISGLGNCMGSRPESR